MPGWAAPSTSTGVPSGSDSLSQPLVSVAAPVPEQCAAWPRYTLEPSWKTKFEVHWAPSVMVWTPGWIVAWSAGAQADAPAGANAKAEIAAAATRAVRAFRFIDPPLE